MVIMDTLGSSRQVDFAAQRRARLQAEADAQRLRQTHQNGPASAPTRRYLRRKNG